jgi:putative protein kinase ArgK-like GTPase of G3E family
VLCVLLSSAVSAIIIPFQRCPVLLMSAATGDGLDAVEDTIRKFHSVMCGNAHLASKRANQNEKWLLSQFRRMLVSKAEDKHNIGVQEKLLDIKVR